jgi:hypothetical protein
MRRAHGCFQRYACSLVPASDQKTVNFSWIERQASRIACASFALAPIVPPSPLAFNRSQNQVPPLFQTAKSTPKWRLRLHEPLIITRLLVKIRPASPSRRGTPASRSPLISSKQRQNWLQPGNIGSFKSGFRRSSSSSGQLERPDSSSWRCVVSLQNCGTFSKRPADQKRRASRSMATTISLKG